MSTTRHAKAGSPPAWERYMSAPEFAELRGVNGAAVAARARLLTSARQRALLFFIQALSLRPGGLRKLAVDLFAVFPERLGSATMHRLGVKPGRVFSETEARQIADELPALPQEAFAGLDFDPPPLPRAQRTAEFFLNHCRAQSRALADFLGELCINPHLEFTAPGEKGDPWQSRALAIAEDDALSDQSFKSASVPFFADIIGALFEFQRRHGEAARAQLAETQVAVKVFATLDRALRHRKMVVIEGEPGVGKSKAVSTWCEMHLGEARLVTLSGSVNKTGIFRKIAVALGVASGTAHKCLQLQAAVESMLERSGLLLCVDESHFLLGHGERVSARPEMLDWIDTSLVNEGVPVALCATPQFRAKLNQVEKQTIWNSAQFRRRVKDYVELPPRPSLKDVDAVAVKLFPGADARLLQEIAAHALTSKTGQQWPLSWMASLAEDARMIATDAGRASIERRDVERALKEFREPSDLAQARAFAPAVAGQRPRPAPEPTRPPTPAPVPDRPPALPLTTRPRYAPQDDTLTPA